MMSRWRDKAYVIDKTETRKIKAIQMIREDKKIKKNKLFIDWKVHTNEIEVTQTEKLVFCSAEIKHAFKF